MSRRLWQGVGALVLGAAFLVAAGLAGASRGFVQAGIFRVGYAGASVQIDPQLAYVSTAWSLEYATAAKLFNYPDRAGAASGVLQPEVASGYKVSRDGRTYTFTIRRGFRFSDGTAVTAKSFAYAIDRVANHDLASPGASFITDQNGTNIVGAIAVNAGKARHVSGVTAKGYRLVIRLTRRDPTLLTKLAMPFFQATSLRLPLTREVVVGGYPSAGPYAFTRNTPDETELRRNRYYRGLRPRNLTGVEVWWNLDQQAGFREVEAGSLDEGPLPDAEVRGVARRFGVNKSRFWVEPTNCVGYVAFNSARRLFRNNVALRQAINWMIDRRALLAPLPAYSGSPWTHLLPPTAPGSITSKKLQPYRGAPNARKARRLAAGHLRAGVVNVGYRSSAAASLAQAQYVRDVLVKLGVKAERIKLKAFAGADIYGALGRQNSDLDLGVAVGWCSDYPEPHGLLSVGSSFLGTAAGTKFQARIDAAEGLPGAARLRAFGRLDLDLMTTLAPIAVTRTYNNRFYFSRRVEPKSLVYVGVYQDWSIPALALK